MDLMLTERNYQPSLLWALVEAWAKQQGNAHNRFLQVYVYRTDRPGAFYLRGPRLYWDDDLGDDYHSFCDQDELWTNRKVLGEVVVARLRHGHETALLGRTYEEALQRLTNSEQMPIGAAAV